MVIGVAVVRRQGARPGAPAEREVGRSPMCLHAIATTPADRRSANGSVYFGTTT